MGIRLIFLLMAMFSQSALADIDAGSCLDAQKSLVSTNHTTTINGQVIPYTATVGFMQVTSADLSAKACLFYTAYTVAPSNGKPRPVTFAFNGGPGSASLWLHLGMLGPKRVDMGLEGMNPPASLDLISNQFSALDVTDIVMIDPVATGFSHAVDPATSDKFFGVRNDYMAIGAFVQNYLITNKRWNSPKFILGESYGGIRGSLLANYLQSDLNIGVDGLILISPALSNTSLDFSAPENNVPYWTYFPNFATTAWYHKKIAAKYQSMTVEQVYTLARLFAFNRLRDALDSGGNLDAKVYDSTAQDIADFVGLDKRTVILNNLQVDLYSYIGGLLENERQIIGRYDSRFSGEAISSGYYGFFDPSDAATKLPFTAGINDYLRGDLAYPLEFPYNTMGDIGKWPGWNDGADPRVMTNMSAALAQNKRFKVFIASGYFDLACPMGTVEYELSQMPGSPQLRARVKQYKYFGGHMMYINPTELEQLKLDVSAFITSPR
jgi:carboxypeptidase C (cathepsin A)